MAKLEAIQARFLCFTLIAGMVELRHSLELGPWGTLTVAALNARVVDVSSGILIGLNRKTR